LNEDSSITSQNSAGFRAVVGSNFYPINFYDPRESEPRDAAQPGAVNGSCQANGILNAVELDVGNLQRWITGAIGANGTKVNFTSQNGYHLFFSDRRGMIRNPNAAIPNTTNGEYGFEDVINSGSVKRHSRQRARTCGTKRLFAGRC
jgi:hypothetical protein